MSLAGDKEITMKARWIGVTGAVLVLTALVLGTLGRSLWPSAFWSSSYSGTMGPGMMSGGMMSGGMASGGMMGPGMMSGGMMSGRIGNGMMGSGLAGNPNQPFDQRFLDQMIMHHQGAVMSAQSARSTRCASGATTGTAPPARAPCPA
jgi:hypothetical protein